jgi:hypothetical protein
MFEVPQQYCGASLQMRAEQAIEWVRILSQGAEQTAFRHKFFNKKGYPKAAFFIFIGLDCFLTNY